MRFAARLILLCAIACGTLGAAPLSPLAALLDKMRSVNGGLYDMHLVSTSPHIVDGTPTLAQTDALGLRYTVRECTGEVCIGSYFDGDRLYRFNLNGTPVPAGTGTDRDLRALRVLGMLQFLDPRFAKLGGAIQDAGTEVFEGLRCRRIIVTAASATPIAVYVDPKTGLVDGARDSADGSTIRLGDYRRVAAFELPFSVDYNGAPIERYITRTIVSDPLQVPHGLTPIVESGTAGRMPLDPAAVSPMGTCKIAGVSARCLIDTGNSTLSISLQLAERLGLKPIGMLHIAGLGNYATEVVHAGPLEMGNVNFGDANYVVLSDAERYGYDLVVGADVLAAMPVTIDYGRHVLAFGLDDRLDGANALSIRFDGFIPVVDVLLGTLPAQLAIDTGDESNINLAYSYYQQHPNLFSITSTAQVGGVGGMSVEELGELHEIRLGGITAQDQPIGTTRTLQGTADGHLGAEFLSKFRIVLDYSHQQLYLTPL